MTQRGQSANQAYAAQLRHVSFSYDASSWALNDISLDIRSGEWVCITGPNGSGKSTLSKVIAGLSAPDDGVVTLLGNIVFDAQGAHAAQYRSARRDIGAVFQNPEDQIVTTVIEDDVVFGPENLGFSRRDMAQAISDSLHSVGLESMRFADPTHISGGQQQRVAIAGAMAMHPRMVVLDEITAMLDPEAREDVMRILSAWHAQGVTIVHVTHLAQEVQLAQRVIRMDHGRIIDDDVPQHQTDSSEKSNDVPLVEEQSLEETTLWYASESEHITDLNGTARNTTREWAIAIDCVTYRYPHSQQAVLDNYSLFVAQGQTVALMGRNGSGKTTLARLISALDSPDEGSITVAGIPVSSRRNASLFGTRKPKPANSRQRKALRRSVGYVMQHPERQLFAETVAQDVAYGPRNQGLGEDEITQRVDEALSLLRIQDLARRSPFDLSGGQQRLVAIAGVIACHPQVLILDEPTANLDAHAKQRIINMLTHLHKQGVTILMITHDAEEAHSLADRIEIMPDSKDSYADGDDDSSGINGTADIVDNLTDATGNTTQNQFSTDSPSHETPHVVNVSAPRHAPQYASRLSGEHIARNNQPVPMQSQNVNASARSSLLSSFDPRILLVVTIIAMFSAFTISNAAQLLAAITLVVAAACAGRIRVGELLRATHGFLVLFIFTGLLNIFFVRTGSILVQWGPLILTTGGIAASVLYICRFALVIILGAIVMNATTPIAVTDACESLMSPLRRFGIHTQDIALVMSLSVRFLPTLSSEARAIADAQASRGGSIESGSPLQRIRALGAIVVPVFAGTLRHADNLSLALDARSYESGIQRTHWRVMSVRRRDMALIACSALYIVALCVTALL